MFSGSLNGSPVTYDDLLRHKDIISYCLISATHKLNEIRKYVPDAGGLIVATDVEHAEQISQTLLLMGEEFETVTYRSTDAQAAINSFRNETKKWIVSIGMISEGTDIPRLQVCCYLSRIRTEMYFRQVLGRVLRRRSKIDENAWLYVVDETTIRHFARRLSQDLPEDLAIISTISDKNEIYAKHAGRKLDSYCHLSPSGGQIQFNNSAKYEHEMHQNTTTSLERVGVFLSDGYRQKILDLF